MILDIIEEPDDIDAFCLSHKYIRSVAAPKLSRHRELKALHNTRTAGLLPRTLTELLFEVLENPITALYVKRLIVDGLHFEGDDGDYHLAPSHSTYRAIVKRETEQAYPHDFGGAQERFNSDWYNEGDECPILLLLLKVLPNLEVLDMAKVLSESEQSIESLSEVLYGNLDQQPAKKLRKFIYPIIDRESSHSFDEHVYSLPCVSKIALLPAMKSIVAREILGEETTGRIHFDDPAAISKVTNLTMNKCCVNPKRLFEFLEIFQHLKTFEWDGRGEDLCDKYLAEKYYNPYWLCQALQTYAASSLQSLIIRSHERIRFQIPESGCMQDRCSKRFVPNLSKFTCLIRLEIQAESLLETVEPHQLCSVEKYLFARLPKSLLHLHVHCGMREYEVFFALLELLLQAKNEQKLGLETYQGDLHGSKDLVSMELLKSKYKSELDSCRNSCIDFQLKLVIDGNEMAL